MGTIAVLASGNGSNFEAIAQACRPGGELTGHRLGLLLCDRPEAAVVNRAVRLGVPVKLVAYKGRPRAEAEAKLQSAIDGSGADLVVLAGFMRILGSGFVEHFRGRLVNIHPSLLPLWPGSEAIARAWQAGDSQFGVTVHFVDEGMDTGLIIAQRTIPRRDSLAATEAALHAVEHELYPEVIRQLLEESGVLHSALSRQADRPNGTSP
ncbi:MAG: phosphoribosylglycinamide formyltransferase [Spirochaetes bacterium GWD1_61_31]|nr:MAG: phosphoribosylglycinamide formyltransferase [Spirochaetes bacterium GWB1_60_80]OHD29763.1 MAG: phosphoribosylglycinamide formyltransferase [Spirochaetes bacterium GWC1_61_12]OHD42896.1 MAG: phosphoribosylglycinamide formyltransferase [Spirochaetes bacterium GWE1_60_18]OHD43473.1 MAG: phosphoribosylglycinamide formyltransferase [Spirochaetes bacterium GWD1_61_31]OHD59566.1 MAG: phosphoribosylglycinamide formyltransferase [Spirochaetes bacterium GWF1_60_12]